MIPSLVALAFVTSPGGIDCAGHRIPQGRVWTHAQFEAYMVRGIAQERETLRFFREHNIDPKLINELDQINKRSEASLADWRAKRAIPLAARPRLTRQESMERLEQAMKEAKVVMKRYEPLLARPPIPPPTPPEPVKK